MRLNRSRLALDSVNMILRVVGRLSTVYIAFRIAWLKSSVIYIVVLPPLDPVKLVLRIMEKVESTGQSPFKWVTNLYKEVA